MEMDVAINIRILVSIITTGFVALTYLDAEFHCLLYAYLSMLFFFFQKLVASVK